MQNFKGLMIMVWLFAVSGATAQTARLYDNGVALFNKKDYRGTTIVMSRVIRKSPYYFEAYTYRGRAYAALGMPDSAKIDFATALQKKPGYLPAVFYRGVLHFDLKEYQDAIADFDVVLQKKPRFIRAFIYRGRCEEALGHDDRAIDDYTKAINLKLKNAEVYFRRGMLYERKHMPKSAIWDYTQCIETDKNYVEAWMHRGINYLQRGKKEEALADFNQVIQMTDTLREAWQYRGDLRFQQGDYQGAAEDYSVVIHQFRVRDAGLYYKRAEAYFLDSNYTLAYKEYSRVLKVKPRDADAIVGQARVNIERKKINSAVPLLRKALAFEPAHAEANFYMGKILFDKEEFDKALEYFNKALKAREIPEAYWLRGSCKVELGDKYGACLDLQKAKALGYQHKEMENALRMTCR